MTPMRLEPGAPRSRVKHSTTEPLRSLICVQRPLSGSLLVISCEPVNVETESRNFLALEALTACLQMAMKQSSLFQYSCLYVHRDIRFDR